MGLALATSGSHWVFILTMETPRPRSPAVRHLTPTIYRYCLFSSTRLTSQEINTPSSYQGLN